MKIGTSIFDTKTIVPPTHPIEIPTEKFPEVKPIRILPYPYPFKPRNIIHKEPILRILPYPYRFKPIIPPNPILRILPYPYPYTLRRKIGFMGDNNNTPEWINKIIAEMEILDDETKKKIKDFLCKIGIDAFCENKPNLPPPPPPPPPTRTQPLFGNNLTSLLLIAGAIGLGVYLATRK